MLIIASECNTIIGEEQQRVHMNYYPNAGHTMFGEQPERSLEVIRKYQMQRCIDFTKFWP